MTNVNEFNVNLPITIRGQQYTFVTDRRQKPFVNGTGGRAAIYKLKHSHNNTSFALKVFKEEYQEAYPSQNFNHFQKILPTMPAFKWVKSRILIDAHDDAALIATYPQLRNAILMPWIDLPTLDELRKELKEKTSTYTSSQKCRELAQILADTLAQLEKSQIAHGDIANSNMLVDWGNGTLYLIDIEDMFHPSLTKPKTVGDAKGGTGGYRFHDTFSSWNQAADRFAGSILIGELLTLDQPESQEASAEESFFTQEDVDNREFNLEAIPRFETMISDVEQLTNGLQISELLRRAWLARELHEVPELSHWQQILGVPDYVQRYAHWNTSAIVTSPPTPVTPTSSSAITTPIKPRQVITPYDRKADSDYPALIVFLLDLSRSMFYHSTPDGSLRFNVALNLLNEITRELIQRSRKQYGIRPRYHVAVIGYHKHTIDLLTNHTQRKPGENNKQFPANTKDGIYPIGALEDIVFDISSISRITTVGAEEMEHPDGVTHMTQAFRTVRRVIQHNIQTYANSHPPFVFHVTDGANTDNEDVRAEFNALTNLSTNYGNVLVSTAYIADNLLPMPISAEWSGISDTTVFTTKRADIASQLRKISSRIPQKYLEALWQKNYTMFQPDSYLFFPGTDKTMLQLAMTISKSTGE